MRESSHGLDRTTHQPGPLGAPNDAASTRTHSKEQLPCHLPLQLGDKGLNAANCLTSLWLLSPPQINHSLPRKQTRSEECMLAGKFYSLQIPMKVLLCWKEVKTLLEMGKFWVPFQCGGSWSWSRGWHPGGWVAAGWGWRCSRWACGNGQMSLNVMGPWLVLCSWRRSW